MSGSFNRIPEVPLSTLESTAHCSRLSQVILAIKPNETIGISDCGGGKGTAREDESNEDHGDSGDSANGATCTSRGIFTGWNSPPPQRPLQPQPPLPHNHYCPSCNKLQIVRDDDAMVLSRLLSFSMVTLHSSYFLFYTYLTLIFSNGSLIFCRSHLSEPDAYPTDETLISTPEGPPYYDKRGRPKKTKGRRKKESH